MSGAVAIFAKTPGHTPAKTRLAAGIGTGAAETFHLLALDAVETAVLRFLRLRPDWTAVWAVAEAEGTRDSRWRRLGARHTGHGSLGERMARVYEELRGAHGRAMLIGADCPQVTARQLDEAAVALEQVGFVAGPARDGGFWLFGGRRAIPADVWTGARFGTEHALADLTAALVDAGLGPPHRLVTLTDVDTAADLMRLVAELPGRRTRAQRRLLSWIARTLEGQP